MDFPQFYKLLSEVMTKEPSGIVPTENNFSPFLMNRYLSFYSPAIIPLLNRCTNTAGFHKLCDKNMELAFELFKAVIPKLPYKFIKYCSKRQAEKNKMNSRGEEFPSDEWIEEYANYKQLSTREVWDMIHTAKQMED